MYEYQATILYHHDGDTSHVSVDLGFSIAFRMNIRWFGINAPELATDAGKASLAALNQKFPAGSVCTLRTNKDLPDKFGGRYDGTFILADGTNMNDWMVANHYAVPYTVTLEEHA